MGLLFNYYSQRGIPITVEFQQGYGLKPGDTLRYRGIVVGHVQDVRLTPELQGVSASVRLLPGARDLARDGSRFWIVRPQVDLRGVTGLDTVIGARYLGVLPGAGEFRADFTGLEEPPVTRLDPGGLTIVLETPGRGGLRAGAPVSYREVPIGVILAVDFSNDASVVEARVYIKPDYSHLIRTNTQFWKTSAARLSAGLSGVSLTVNSLRDLLMGGISLATPPQPGQPAISGQHFVLHDEADQDWLTWKPSLPAHAGLNPPQPLPRPVPAELSWRYKNLLQLTRAGQRSGWALGVGGGWLGPADLLTAPAAALSDSVHLTLAGKAFMLSTTRPIADGHLVLLPDTTAHDAWQRIRAPASPEDGWLLADPAVPPRFVAASRYHMADGVWLLDPDLPFDDSWHGASVVAQTDGALLGLLSIDSDGAYVTPLDENTLATLTADPSQTD
ncbi:MAG: MCE family protein [Gammaproteobacteria bacterium]|nr:MCE family protein [Gammaproteobacteria bacterium]MCP5459591.1 MCE family protein [Gammaproteobacteria bacterium]